MLSIRRLEQLNNTLVKYKHEYILYK